MTRASVPGLVFVATCDLAGLVRGRAAPISELSAVLDRGVGWVPADLAINAFGHLVEPNAFGPIGDLRLMPDTQTLATLGGGTDRPELQLYLADQTCVDGSPWTCCPRTFLRTAVEQLAADFGLVASAAFEHEFHLAGSPPAPPFSLRAMLDAEPFGTDFVAALDAAGLEPENWLAEFGAAQFEVTVAPRPALVAADRAVTLREIARDTAARHGRRVSFAPMLDPTSVGNGVHVHISLTSASDGKPCLFDPAAPGGLSQLGACFAQGIVEHAAAIVALTAPSPVSHLRLVPHRWSTAGAFVGAANREAMIRLSSVEGLPSADAARRYNLEYRAADATANPYLALGALLHAGMAGLRQGRPATVRVGEVTEADLAKLAALPASLDEALDALRGDSVVCSWFDPVMLDTYLAVKRSELDHVAALDGPAQCRAVADVY